MKIAIPIVAGKLSAHFGHCESFAILDVDTSAKKILKRDDIKAPPHQPGLLPPWLAQQGANVIIAGGMGGHAQELFAQYSIRVVLGAPSDTPEEIVRCYLNGSLQSGLNVCDHVEGHECSH
ncbi:MAG TPA: NifB/NifX family molybdenum-iron cluster-binding protein [Elusimicrobiota bacterium]|nr:NifB/NifX family molybdenum-iron cluster-binding protein [Elusimicrobiota bacterium]